MSVSDLLTAWPLGSWGVLALLFILVAIPMGPAEPTAFTAGATAASLGVPLWQATVVVAVGMLVGDLTTYWLAGTFRHRLIRRHRARQRLQRWQLQLNKCRGRRDLALAGLRFIPGARTPTAVAARYSGVSTPRYLALAAIGAVAWAVFWTSAAAVFRHHVGLLTAAAVIAAVVLFAGCVRSGAHPTRPTMTPGDQNHVSFTPPQNPT